MTSVRVCIVPRWAAGPDDVWYPHVRRRLRPEHEVVTVPLRPSPRAPTIAASVIEIASRLGDDTARLADTVLVGHSVGCQAAMRYLATLPDGARVAALVCVAGWLSIDEPWDTIAPWIETPLDFARVRRATGRTLVLVGDDDPFTRDYQATGRAFQEHLGADVVVAHGGGHFNRVVEPAVDDLVAAVVRAG